MSSARGCLVSARGQAAALGVIFFFCFSAYDTIQVFAKRLYPGDTGANSTLCVYVAFTIGCLFVAPIITVLGERLSIAIGVLCYASLVVAGLVYLCTGYAAWLILLGGSLLGCGASLLWTAQGSLILSYGANEKERGRVFAIFWSLYRAAPLLGGVLSLCYFSLQDDQDAGSPALFVIFLVLIVTGGFATMFLRDPAEVRTADDQNSTSVSRSVPLLVPASREAAADEAHKGTPAVSPMATLIHVADPMMLLLGLLFCSSGFNEAYVLSEFSRLVTTRAVGLEEICFYSGSVIGTHCCGMLVDRCNTASPPSTDPLLLGALTWRTRWILSFASVLHFVAFALAAVSEALWASAADEGPSGELNLDDGRVAVPTVAFLLWGMSDGLINTWLYWLIGALYPEAPAATADKWRAPINTGKLLSVAVYKMLNSGAHVVGYVLLDRVAGWAQLVSNVVLYVLGLTPVVVECARTGRAAYIPFDAL